MSERRAGSIWQNVALLFASLLLVGLFCEGLFRLVGLGPLKMYQGHPTKLFELVPNQRSFTSQNRKPIRINSQAIREDEIPLAKPEGMYRIMVVGDSTTFGYGILLEDSWPKQLQRRLNEHFDDFEYLVINASTSNYDMVNERIFFEETGVGYEPDMVLVGFSLNDIRLKSGNHYAIQEDGSILPEDRAEWNGRLEKWRIVKKSALLSRLYLIYGSVRYAWPEYRSLKKATPEILANWERGMREYQKLLEFSQERGIEMGIVYLPYRYALDEDEGEVDRPRQKFRAFEASTDAFLIDPMATLRQARRSGVEIFPPNDPIHMNEAGMDIAAQFIFEDLVKRRLLAPAGGVAKNASP